MTDSASRRTLVEGLHASPFLGVLAITGGGSGAVAELLRVPGASNTVLEAIIPYSQASLAGLLGGAPDQACHVDTARAMAMAAFRRALMLSEAPANVLFGLGASASLRSLDPKRGDHRVHVAIQTLATTLSWSLTLQKGARTREEEEQLAAHLILNSLAQCTEIEASIGLGLGALETIDFEHHEAEPHWYGLLTGDLTAVAHPQDSAATSRLVFPGAFNPYHDGHRQMAELAERHFGVNVEYELCIHNVDKPSLNYADLRARIQQFPTGATVWLTATPTFVEKSRVFAGCRFIVGADTLVRIGDARYYDDDEAKRDRAVAEIADHGCRFLVFGRRIGKRFVGLADLELPEQLR
ncbi:MAG: hypothetical protein P8Y95_11720, partial [Gammaproteobacteria bacterium]